MAKVRVYELAKELGIESKVAVAKLNEMGEFVRSASSTIEAPVVRRLKEAFGGSAAKSADGKKAPAPKPGPRKPAPKPAAPKPDFKAEPTPEIKPEASVPPAPSRPVVPPVPEAPKPPAPGPQPGPR